MVGISIRLIPHIKRASGDMRFPPSHWQISILTRVPFQRGDEGPIRSRGFCVKGAREGWGRPKRPTGAHPPRWLGGEWRRQRPPARPTIWVSASQWTGFGALEVRPAFRQFAPGNSPNGDSSEFDPPLIFAVRCPSHVPYHHLISLRDYVLDGYVNVRKTPEGRRQILFGSFRPRAVTLCSS